MCNYEWQLMMHDPFLRILSVAMDGPSSLEKTLMKCAILTYHAGCNFGANLQALATSLYLRQMQVSHVVLNYDSINHREKRAVLDEDDQLGEHLQFCSSLLPLTRPLYSEEDIETCCVEENVQCIILGSDAVLQLHACRNYKRQIPAYWLSKVEGDFRRSMVAASCMGSDFRTLGADTLHEMGNALNRFSFVSVRDAWTKKMLEYVGYRGAIQLCPDPTIVLDDLLQQYGAFADTPLPDDAGKYVCLSFYAKYLKPRWIKQLIEACHEKGYKTVALPTPEGNLIEEADFVLSLPVHPLTWFKVLRNASGFIGVRFHPVTICLQLGIPFVAFDTYASISGQQGSKTYNLCKQYRLTQQYFRYGQVNHIAPARVMQRLDGMNLQNLQARVAAQKDVFAGCVNSALGVKR